MKKVLLITTLILLTGMSYAKDGMKQFYAQHRHDKNVQHINLPKILLRFSNNEPEVRKLVRHMKSLKLFEMDGGEQSRPGVSTELESALKTDGYESILQVAETDEKVSIYILQDDRYIRKVLITVNSNEELVILQANTRLSFDHLSALINGYKDGKGPGLKKRNRA